MALKFHPRPGQVLSCDFAGYVIPEMVKKRPVVVVSPGNVTRQGLTMIVPLSNTAPNPVCDYHYKLIGNPIPGDSARCPGYLVWTRFSSEALPSVRCLACLLDMSMKFVRSGGRRYVKLCESFGDGTGKSRQRVVANPGRLEALEAGSSSALINGLLRAAGKPTLDEGTGETEFAPGRSMGDTWLLTSLWQELGLDEAFRRILRRKRSFDAEHLLRVMVFYRLCDPESKLGILPWLEQTVVPDVDTDGVTHPRLLLSIDNIGIAPVYHRLPERIRAHALICFLALVLHRVLRMRLKAGTSTVSPNRALEEIRQIQLHKVMLHRRHAASGLTTLIPEQRHLFETIGLPAPSRVAL